MQSADDVMVQAYLWMATASSLAAAVWVARRKLFGEDPMRDVASAEPQRNTASLPRRLSAEWDDESSLLEHSDDANSFASDSYYQRSQTADVDRRSSSPSSSGARRAPYTPSSSVHFSERVEISPSAESILASPGVLSEPVSAESVLMKVVDHLDRTAAQALQTFYKYDSDGFGTLSVAQLTSVLAELGLHIELDDVHMLAQHMGVLSAGSVLDDEVLSIKGFLRALKQARNVRRAAEENIAPGKETVAPAPAPEAAAAAATAPPPSKMRKASEPPTSAGELLETKETTDDVHETQAQVQQPVPESKPTERTERTAWAAATSRDGKLARPQSASRPRPRSQEAELANTRRALDHYETGCEHLDDGNWTAAEAELRRALTLQPNFPDCQRRLAALKRKQGEDAALNTRQSTLGFTPQIERKPHTIARGRLATPHVVNGPTISSSRKAVGNLVATGRVVPASAPASRRGRLGSPQTRAADEQNLHNEPPTTEMGYRMEQLKAERGKEEVVQRLYDWELSKKARIEEAQDRAAPPFTPQLSASIRRSEYDHAELDEADAGPGLVDRCFEWSHSREEWIKAKQDEQLRDFQRNNKRATEEDINGAGRAFPTPKRYQRKAEAWGSLDFVSRMAEADREKHEKLDEVRREKLAAQQAEEEKHLVHARKIVATKEEAEEIAERLFRWEAEKQNVLNDVRQEIEETQRIEPKPRFDSASRSLIDSFDTRVPVTDRLLHWREVHNEELEQKRVQTLAEAETELTFQPKLGKTAQHVRSNRPLSKDNVFETLYDTASSHASKFKTANCNKAKGASETARVELRAELEGLTVSLLKKRAAAAGVSVDAMLAAMQAAEDARIPRHAARGEHGWKGSIEHVAEEKNAVIEAILNNEQVPHSRSFNKNARVGRGGFLSGPARNAPDSSNGQHGQRQAAITRGAGPAPRVASLSPTRGRRGRPASTDRRKSPQQQIKTPAEQRAAERVHFMRFNSAEKRRHIRGGPEICDDGKPLSLPGTPTRTSPGLAVYRAACESDASRHQSIGSRLNMHTHTQSEVRHDGASEASERTAEMNVKDTQEYFNERHALAQAKKRARRQEHSAMKAASGENSRVKTTIRPKGAANPLLSAKPNERLAQLSKPRLQPAAAYDANDVSSTRKEPLSPGHVPRTAAPRHRVRRQSPRRSSDHSGQEAALAVSPDSRAAVDARKNQPQTGGPDWDRAAALEAAHNALRLSGLASTENPGGVQSAAASASVSRLLEERSQSGQPAHSSGWTLDSFH